MGRAGVKRYVYREDAAGNLRALPIDGPLPTRHGGTLESMEDRVVRDLHELECQHGSRFDRIGEFSAAQLKQIWIDNRERDNAFDRARERAFRRAQEQHQ